MSQSPITGLFSDYLQSFNTQQANPYSSGSNFDVLSSFDPNNLDLTQLQNLDLSGLNLSNINLPSYGDIRAALTGGSPTPSSLSGYVNAYNSQVNLLSSAGTLENVDIDDRPYWYNSTVSGILGDNKLDPALLDQFKTSAGIPDSFAVYDSGAGITEQSAQTVYGLLSSTDDPMQALSEYYGIDLSRAENPDAVYNNADKYGSDANRLAEFQSIIEPVLQKVIPYIQVTQGLRYDDALEYAYKNDPMIAAIYNQYGVDLFRQTSDGSTYFFDPISGTESRTVEVKDSSFRDVGLALTAAAFSWITGGALTGVAGMSATQANTLASVLTAGVRSGFDPQTMLAAAVTSGLNIEDANQFVNGAAKAAAGTLAGGGSLEDALKSGLIGGTVAWGVDKTSQFFSGDEPSAVAINPETGAPYGALGVATGPQDTGSFDYTALNESQQNLTNLTDQFDGDVIAAVTGDPFGVDLTTELANIAQEIKFEDTQGTQQDDTTTTDTIVTTDTPAGGMEEVIVTGEYDPNYHGFAPSHLTPERGFTVNPLRGNDGEILRYVYVATDANGNETLVVSPDYFAKGGDSYGLSGEDLANFLANYQLGNAAYSSFGVDTPFPDGFDPFAFGSNATQIDVNSDFDPAADTSETYKPEKTEAPDVDIDTSFEDVPIEIEFDPQAPEFTFELEFEELPEEIQQQLEQAYNDAYRQAVEGGAQSASEAAAAAKAAVMSTAVSQGVASTTPSDLNTTQNDDGSVTASQTDNSGNTTTTTVDTSGNVTSTTTTSSGSSTTTTTSTDDNTTTTGSTDSTGEVVDSTTTETTDTTTKPDTDGDGIPDSQDDDIDGEGVPNGEDFDPTDPSIFEDTTASGLDSDGDGLLDSEDPFPNDPLNGTGDADGDGIQDSQDEYPDDPLNGATPSTQLPTGGDQTQPAGGDPDVTDGGGIDGGIEGTTDGTTGGTDGTTGGTDGTTGGTTGGTDGTTGGTTGGTGGTTGGTGGTTGGTGGTTGNGGDTGDGGNGNGDNGDTGDNGDDTGDTGNGTGDGEGDGEGDGTGSGSGTGSGGGLGVGGGLLTGGTSPVTPQSFMASISYAPELLTPYMPKQSKDYLAELIARLQK